jgi:spore germination cell wall hydrolase CwlJ-like protein
MDNLRTFENFNGDVSEEEVITATLIGEAGGEGVQGIQAVLNVLQNRAKKRNSSVAREALRPKQFSMWNPVLLKNKSQRQVVDQYKNHKYYDDVLKAIKRYNPNQIKFKDITNGATHYYAHNKVQPFWAKKPTWKKIKQIGNHTFGIDKSVSWA